MMSSGNDEQNLMNDFNGYLKYSDIKYYTIKSILNLVKIKERANQSKSNQINDQSNVQSNVQFTDNVIKILLSIKLPLCNNEKGRKELDNLRPFILDNLFKFNYESASNLYSDAWQIVLSFKVGYSFDYLNDSYFIFSSLF